MSILSLIIPAFNEEDNLPTLHKRITAASALWQMPFEVILIDDGSSDNTLPMLRELHQQDPRFKYLSFSRNFGHQTAISAGLRYAAGDVVAILDADLQDPPEELPRFLDKWREGYQVIYGVRRKRKENVVKRSAYFLFYRLMAWMSSIEIPLDAGDFCVMDRVIVEHLNRFPERNRFVRGLRSWIGYRQIGIPYERHSRFAGEVKYTLHKLIRLALDGIINFSYRPLQVVGAFGFLVAIFSFLSIVFFLLHRVLDFKIFGYSPQDVPGFTSMILAVLFIGGVQLFTLGIMGEYIGRIFDEIKQRPHYIIQEQTCATATQTRLPGEMREA